MWFYFSSPFIKLPLQFLGYLPRDRCLLSICQNLSSSSWTVLHSRQDLELLKAERDENLRRCVARILCLLLSKRLRVWLEKEALLGWFGSSQCFLWDNYSEQFGGKSPHCNSKWYSSYQDNRLLAFSCAGKKQGFVTSSVICYTFSWVPCNREVLECIANASNQFKESRQWYWWGICGLPEDVTKHFFSMTVEWNQP